MPRHKTSYRALTVSQLIEMRDQIESALGEKIEAERSELQGRLAQLDSLEPRRAVKTVGAGRGRRRGSANGKGRVHPLKGTKAPIKYRGPNGETWSGRGLAPRWLAELEKKGKKRDSYLIAPAN
jgi:DNA-binding protein H-NS